MFIFIFQTIWLFIDEVAGKGLDLYIIGKFILYLMPNLTEKVLPLTVLLSSILTFGTFAENYEFAAMKASGISLQRSMRSLIIFVTLLGGVTFFFANNVIPASEQKIYNLRKNIAKIKPAMAITEGVFSDFEGTGEGMNIKVARKHGDNDRFLEDVIIHKKTKTLINNTVIKAKTGELISSEDSDLLQLVLRDGYHYEEVTPEKKTVKTNYPFVKSTFETYTMNIDLSGFNNVDLNEERDISTDKMKNISRLIEDRDSIKGDNLKVITAFSKNVTNRIGVFIRTQSKDSVTYRTNKMGDSLPIFHNDPVNKVVQLYSTWQREQLLSSAKNSITNVLNTIRGKKEDLERRYKIYNMHILSLHKKFALAFSCIILFFVGAPLGAIIRKGGLGLPMVIAIILFLTYYFIGVFTGNSAKGGGIHPILGAWIPTLIMLPLGIFLTKRATADRGLISFGNIVDAIKKLFKKDKSLEA